MIEIKSLSKKYADGTLALNRFTARLEKRITSIVGRNGAGKTTLTRILSTQMLPTSGSAYINGLDVVREADLVRGIIVSIPQDAKPMSVATPYDHLSMYLNARGLPADEIDDLAEKAMRDLDIWRVRNKSTGDLSGGMRRKVFVAMALASKAEVIFLDEPTTGLDPISRLEVWSAIKKLKSTIIITTHYMEEAKELSDEVILVEAGKKVMQGSVPELLRRFNGKVRLEGPTGRYRVGSIHISYVTPAQAKRMLGKRGYSVKQVSLEDLFLITGSGFINESEDALDKGTQILAEGGEMVEA